MRGAVHEWATNKRIEDSRFEYSWLYSWMVFGVTALGETIRIMKEVDAAIVSAGGWAVK